MENVNPFNITLKCSVQSRKAIYRHKGFSSQFYDLTPKTVQITDTSPYKWDKTYMISDANLKSSHS